MADVAVFVSYSHNDDQATYGRIQKFSSDVRSSYKSLSGLDAEMFFDTESIDLGDNWRNRIRSGLLGAERSVDTFPCLTVRSPPIPAVILVAAGDGCPRATHVRERGNRGATRIHGSIGIVCGVCSARRDP